MGTKEVPSIASSLAVPASNILQPSQQEAQLQWTGGPAAGANVCTHLHPAAWLASPSSNNESSAMQKGYDDVKVAELRTGWHIKSKETEIWSQCINVPMNLALFFFNCCNTLLENEVSNLPLGQSSVFQSRKHAILNLFSRWLCSEPPKCSKCPPESSSNLT